MVLVKIELLCGWLVHVCLGLLECVVTVNDMVCLVCAVMPVCCNGHSTCLQYLVALNTRPCYALAELVIA